MKRYYSYTFVKSVLFIVLYAGLCVDLAAQPLNGTYTVGPVGDYANVQVAINDMKAKGISGPVTFNIKSGVYNAAYVIPAITGASETATITFQAESGNPDDVILHQNGIDYPAFLFDGAKYVTLRHVTVIGKTASYPSVSDIIQLIKSSRNNTITGCIIQSAGISNGISLGEYDVPGHNAFNTTISHNIIRGGRVGILVEGNLFSPDSGNVITSNTLIDFLYYGMEFRRVQYLHVSNNFLSSKQVYQGLLNLPLGIYMLHGYNVSILNNTIYLYELTKVEQVVFESPTLCLAVTYGEGNKFINNILVNKTSYGAVFGYREVNVSKLEAHHNILYSAGALFAEINEKEYYDLNSVRDYYGIEKNSFNLFPLFISDTDLHIHQVSIPFVDGLADVEYALWDDIDSEQRNHRYPDIGADEVIDLNIDLGISSVEPTYLNDSTFEIKATLINDGKGSLNGTSPKLSYSTDGGSTWTAPESLSITGLNNTYDTLVYTFNTLLAKKQIQSNMFCARIDPGSLSADANLKNNTYCDRFCAGSISGTFTVGSTPGSDFSTIKKAIVFLSLFCELSGPVTVEIGPGIYEDQLEIPFFKGTSPVNTVSFRSASGNPADVLIRHNGDNELGNHATIKLRESRYIRLKDLSIDNRADKYASGIQFTAGASHNTVENCRIQLDTSIQMTSLRAGIVFAEDSNVTVTSFTQTDDNTFINNQISGGDFGIFLKGQSTQHNLSNQVLSNRISSVRQCGIHAEGQDSIRISRNQISLQAGSQGSRGIEVIKSNKHAEVSGNHIIHAAYIGMLLDNVKGTDTAVIVNNIIGGGFQGNIPGAGILLNEVRKMGCYYNSVAYDHTHIEGSAIRIAGGASVSLLNNIFYNAGQGYAAYFDDTLSVSNSDHNNYYTMGNMLAWRQGPRIDMESLQAATGMDNFSLSVNPLFAGSTDLHTQKAELDGTATPVTGIMYDHDQVERHPSTPDIGAYEFMLGQDVAVTAIINPGSEIIQGSVVSVSVEVSNLGTAALSDIPVRLMLNGMTQQSDTLKQTLLSGQKAVHTFAPLTLNDTGSFELCGETKWIGDIAVFNDRYCMPVYIKDTTQTSIEQSFQSIYTVFPNPADIQMFINCSDQLSQPLHLTIYNTLGQQLMQMKQSCNNEGISIPVQRYPDGVYLLRIESSKGIRSIKFQVKHP